MAELAIAAGVVTVYAALLTGAAVWAERRDARGRPVTANRYVYALALGVYATSWTFYGSVGFAARTGLLFLTVYLGPTLCAAGWWWIVRKLVRIKNAQDVTSLPDVLALRYEKSQGVALLASAVLVVGLIPYVALQLKTMISTLSLVAGSARFAYPASGRQLGPPLVAFLTLFTIVFGLRRIRPAERHPGMMCALAIESLVKLVAFLAAGAFVVWGLFDGPGDVFRAAAAPSVQAPALLGDHGVGAWLAHLVLSGLAVLLLPRQFHLAVVENSDEDHIRTATWLFPAYLLLINVFVLPVALGGLALRGSAAHADTFVLSLPLEAHLPVLSWLVFLGGFSAGTGMVIVETTALSTILSNHVVLPAADAWSPLGGLRRHVLPIRWIAAAALLVAAFAYERAFGSAYSLASIGLVSFAAVLQLAPALLGGLFWPGASRAGALAGLAGGFAVWAYTLVVPVLARAGWLPSSLLAGPFGLQALAPEGLFHLHTDPVTHAVVWTLIVNVGAFVVGSLLWPADRPERTRADRLLAALGREPADLGAGAGAVPATLRAKRAQTVALFERYHPRPDAEALAAACLAEVPGGSDEQLRPLQLASFLASVERTLGGAIGSAAAHAAVRRAGLVTPGEGKAISAAYGELLAGLNLSPEELLRKIDYHRERERLLARDAADQQFLAGVSGLLSSSLELEATAANAVRLPLPHLSSAALLALRSAGVLRTWFAHVDPERERAGRDALERVPLREPGSVARALRTGHVSTCSPPDPDWPADLLDAVGPVEHEATFPLLASGERLGTLTLLAPAGARIQSPEGLALAEELARRLAIAVDNARLYASAEQAIRAREEFLAVASHELKTPLTPLRIQIQALERLVRRGDLEGVPREKLAKLVQGADAQILRIVALIDRLLDLTRIRAKRLRLEVGPMDLAATVQATLEQHAAELRDAGCRVVLDAAAPVFGTWDRLRVEQVVANLVTNAAKYAPGAAVTVRVGADPSRRRARIEVRDQGPGIPRAAQERLFRPFERAGGAGATAGGLGLGLFIVREIVEAHGGAVQLLSAPGEGSSFVVELPFRPPERVAGSGARGSAA